MIDLLLESSLFSCFFNYLEFDGSAHFDVFTEEKTSYIQLNSSIFTATCMASMPIILLAKFGLMIYTLISYNPLIFGFIFKFSQNFC